MTADPIQLAQRLIAFETVNPPGNELECARFLASILEEAGFNVQFVPLGEDRASLIATKGTAGKAGPLVFTGHIDVVPLGTKDWTYAPFAGEISGDKLYGRGSSDMKGGLAAFVCAAIAEAEHLEDHMQLSLIITAGEETGCEGADAIAAAGVLGAAGALVVAEPTANRPFVGHKGALWLRGIAHGVTAHGSMPEEGDNAVYKAARAAQHLSCFNFGVAPHPTLGSPTLNVGTFQGGLNVNSVPDRATIEIDIRTVPGMDHENVRDTIHAHMQEDMDVEVFIDLPGVWTSPEEPWVQRTVDLVTSVTGTPTELRTATYFSDASVLVPAFGGVPTLILGPGEPTQAHQTDEWCSVDAIKQATIIYRSMIVDWATMEKSNV